jgi:hypothetical protein
MRRFEARVCELSPGPADDVVVVVDGTVVDVTGVVAVVTCGECDA